MDIWGRFTRGSGRYATLPLGYNYVAPMELSKCGVASADCGMAEKVCQARLTSALDMQWCVPAEEAE